MRTNDIPFFYKYMSCQTAKIVLKNATLRWSIPSHLNDPFDAQLDLFRFCDDIDQIVDQAIQIWRSQDQIFKPFEKFVVGQKMREKFIGNEEIIAVLENIERKNEELEALRKKSVIVKEKQLKGIFEKRLRSVCEILGSFEDRAKYTPVLCLSEAVDSRLMWSHYADSYSGIALQFASKTDAKTSYSDAQPIRYVEQLPKALSTERIIEDYLVNEAPTLDLSFESLFPSVFLTKSNDWAYEKEWRVLFLDEDTANMFSSTGRKFVDAPFDRSNLSGVIFGIKIQESERQEIIGMVGEKYSGVDFYQLRRSDSGFELELESFNLE